LRLTIWSQGIFNLSKSTLDELLKCLDTFDTAIFVLSDDDELKIREESKTSIRDNVLFELGLFIGRLGQNRTFMVKPRSTENFHIPTDLLGITVGDYDNKRSDGNIQAALGPFCFSVRKSLTQITKDLEITDENISSIDQKYDDLMNKLIQLGGYNRLLEGQSFPSDSSLDAYHKLRAEVFQILKSDFHNFLEMVSASGIISIFHGDIDENAYVTLEINSIDFLNNDFIQFNTNEISQSSMDIPSSFINWFSDRYDIIKKDEQKEKI
jgi:hypothetical protein